MLETGCLIKTPNADKFNAESQYMTMMLTQPATVYMLSDNRLTTVPAWLALWTRVEPLVQTTDVDLSVRSRDVSTGLLTLPGNATGGMVGAASNYVVIIVPR